MINIKVTTNTKKEDYIAIERETGAIALPSKHLFGIFSVGIISVFLALPFGQLIPTDSSPFTAYSTGKKEKNQVLELQYLKNDEALAEKNIVISEAAGSEENYDDEIATEVLIADKSDDNVVIKDSSVDGEKVAQPLRDRFTAKSEQAIADEAKAQSKEFIENVLTPEKISAQKKRGNWYEQTVRRGDSLYKIFSYLNLSKEDYKKITFAGRKENLSLTIGDKLQFLIDKDNTLLEIFIPVENQKQLHFVRDSETNKDHFTMVKIDRLSEQQDTLIANDIKDASDMPSVALAKTKALEEQAAKLEKEQMEKQRLALLEKEKARKELQIQKQKEALERKELALAKKREQQHQKLLLTTNRPRLLIATINKNENFDRAAKRVGLTNSEIRSIKNQYHGKLNVRKLRAGDNFRVLFNGIGNKSTMTAIVIDSREYGVIPLYRHPQNHIFYQENEYNPTSGVFRRFPIMGQVKVSSPFNLNRFHPVKKVIRPHYGVDFKLSIGTPIYAPADGVVTYASYMRGGGYTVKITHKGGYSTVYMHLSKFDVKKGDEVHIGQMIAKSGNTGISTGPHLHYEVHVNGRVVDPLKVDLPSGTPAMARRLKDSFNNTVFILKTELYKKELAEHTEELAN
ncbi:peptidoglycan DD-metalloendopeptidase family protein [Succinivibrio faecicola]|uniref:Peptidoglycan DD-metalloendopeptidase family protein n=1 Tax=Succinivibrio faecicola TaxID=2820300 RepID=A0ABS7DDN6_9GAMM|nr:peptidoglycan DD-metalloendopeptidase family protein [Succinivibrio faecicola]MBW7569409.1 peptidoglycan DD-metalloendopeptidase family protein [Succinivibrio faecicola]